MSTETECFGCRLANGAVDTYIIYEDDLITCLLDIDPINEGHILILPKRHYVDVDELDDNTAYRIIVISAKMVRLLKRAYQADGITILQNGGMFNDLTHYHMHVIPRYLNDGFAWIEPKNDKTTAGDLHQVRKRLVKHL